ncbi:MAG TPA: hypothetical protein VF764_05425, partial [Steroidobacteraceae bacterium]
MAENENGLPEELRARLAEKRRVRALRRREARGSSRNEPTVPPVDDDLEDVSIPTSQPAMTEMPDAPPPAKGDPTDPYNVWLMVLEPETREMFSELELRELFDEQRALAAAEKKARRKKEITALALSTARSDMGLLPAQRLEQMRVAQLNAKKVWMVPTMPPAQD